VEARRKFLDRFEAVNSAGLSAQDALSRELMIRNLRQDIEEARFRPWEMPVNQMEGPHLGWLEMVSLTPLHTVRLRQLSVAIASGPQGAQSGDRQHAAGNERRADAA
jgi:uncharacterized protein (DUF885 family)